MSIVYYVSGHGYGHGRRSAQVIASLLRARPDVTVHVRTTAPARIFAALPQARVRRWEVELDSGAAEIDALTIDVDRTAQAVETALRQADYAVRAEVEFIRRQGVRLILADVPFLAGRVASASGVPCAAITNFTWDWIYAPFLAPRLLEPVAAAYGQVQTLLRLPFSGCSDRIRDVIDVPLVTRRSHKHPQEILRRLSLDGPARGRGRILVALRGGISEAALARAARSSPQLEFLCVQPLGAHRPANLKEIQLGGDLDFCDLLAISDVAVSKLGYGTIAECIASGTALLWPPRTGFREDQIVEHEAPRYLRMRRIDREPFEAGDWACDLAHLMASPPPTHSMPIDGAEFCARWIAQHL